jgi:hypothetical protein
MYKITQFFIIFNFLNNWSFKIKYIEINEDNDVYETKDHFDDEPGAGESDPRYAVEQNLPDFEGNNERELRRKDLRVSSNSN